MVTASIYPRHAAVDHCTAPVELVQDETTAGGWRKIYRGTATAAGLWVFDHWELSSHGYTESDGTRTDEWNDTYTIESATISGGGWTHEGLDEWNIDEEREQLGHYHTEKTVTNLVAVFRPAALKSGYPLRNASGSIMCDRYGQILADF